MSTHAHFRRFAMLGLAIAVASTTLIATENASAPPASATTTTTLITATARQGLADAVNAASFPTGSTIAVVAENSAAAVHIASNYASVRQLPLVVATSGTSATDVTPRLSSLHSTHVVLVSSTASWFSTAFQTSLTTAGVTKDTYIQSSDAFTRWTTAAGSSAAEYVIARSDNTSAVNLATAYADSRKAPLILFDSTTPAATLKSFFTAVDGKKLTFFDPAIVPGDQMTSAENEQMTTVDVTDPAKAFAWVASEVQLYGASSNRVFVGAADAVDELGLAGLAASKSSSLTAPAGARASLSSNSRANEYLALWRNNTESVTLVGVNFTSTNLSSVASPTTVAPTNSPTFRVATLARTSTTFTVGTTAVAGATSYAAYDSSGAIVATASTPNLVFSSAPSSVLIVASGAAGEIARVDVHANYYDATSSLDNVVFVDAHAGTNHLRLLGAIHTPRLITRITNDPFADPVAVYGTATPIGITCSGDFTDATGDGAKEYVYEVTDLSNVDVRACGSSYPQAAANATTGNQIAKVTAPPTDIPCFCRGANGKVVTAAPSLDKVAGISTAQKFLNRSFSPTAAGKTARRGPGDGWAPVITEWQAYIPEAKIPFPGYSGDLAKPLLFFGGDGHGTWNPNESARFIQKVTWTFGTGHAASYYEQMGTSHEYKCGVGGCTEIATATAPLSELGYLSLGSGATWGSATLTASAHNPLVSIAPPIDTLVNIYLSDVTSWVRGYHDRMPKHEFYIGSPGGEYLKVYESSYVSGAVQLPCLYSSPTNPIPGCAVYFNAMI